MTTGVQSEIQEHWDGDSCSICTSLAASTFTLPETDGELFELMPIESDVFDYFRYFLGVHDNHAVVGPMFPILTSPDGDCLLHALSNCLFGIHDPALSHTLRDALRLFMTNPNPNPNPSPHPDPNPSPHLDPSPHPNPNPSTRPDSNPDPGTNLNPNPTSEPNPNSSPNPNPTSNPNPNPTSDPNPNSSPNPNPNPTSNPNPNPNPIPTMAAQLYSDWREFKIHQDKIEGLIHEWDEHVLRSEYNELIRWAETPGEHLEQFHVFCLANVIRRPIVVYADTRLDVGNINMRGVYLPKFIRAELCCKNPLLIVYQWLAGKGHFTSVAPMDNTSHVPLSESLDDIPTDAPCSQSTKLFPTPYADPMLLWDYLSAELVSCEDGTRWLTAHLCAQPASATKALESVRQAREVYLRTIVSNIEEKQRRDWDRMEELKIHVCEKLASIDP